MKLMLVQDDPTCVPLTRALEAERRLINDLRQALLRQRAGIAAADTSAIEASAQVISRTLSSLSQARRTREQLVTALAGDASVPLAQLEDALGGTVPPALRDARAALRASATATASEVAINQHVLRRALEAGNAFLQRLFASAANPLPMYSPAPKRPSTPSGVLVNQRA